MTRFPYILTKILTIMILMMAAGSVCAQELEYRRIFVPSERPDLWPMQDQRYVPVPKREFQKLLDEANQTPDKTPFTSDGVRITAADYTMTLEAGSEDSGQHFLSGHASLQVMAAAKGKSEGSFLTLGPADMNLKNLVWSEEKKPIPTGTDAHNHRIARVDRSGTIEFDLIARNRSAKPGELQYDLSLPLSTRSAVVLSLDPTWTVSVTSGLLLDRTTLEAPVPDKSEADETSSSKTDAEKTKPSTPAENKIRWTVAPTLEGRLSFLLVKKKDPTALPEIPDACESLVYEFSPRGLEFRGVLRLASSGAMLPERLRLGLEKPLTLISARLGSLPVKWTLESEEAGRSTVLLELPKSRPQKATLRLKAACPIVENDDWRLPRIVPEKVFWRSGDMTLLVTSPLSIGNLVPMGCVRTKIGELPAHKGRSIELTSFRPDATAIISLGWEKHLPTLNSGTVAELSGVGVTATQTLIFTASQEDRFELTAMVKPDWIIDSVESSPSSIIADWRVEPSAGELNEKLTIRLASALSKHRGTLRLKLSARRLQSPLGKKLSIQDLTPVMFEDVHHERCLTAITTVDPYSVTYRNEEFVDRVAIDDVSVGQDALFSRIPVGKIFADNARSARLEIVLEEQKPVYTATVETIVTLTEAKLVEKYRFRCVPEASHIDRLLIHLSGEEEIDGVAQHQKGDLHFLPRPMDLPLDANHAPSSKPETSERAFLTLSPKSFSAVRLTPADQASVGTSSSGETWEITLKTPQNEPFEVYAVRSSRFGRDLPVKVCPSLAALPKAVEHHATLQIETTDAASLWIKNHRLEPITITPTTPLQIQKLRAAFHYETTDALAPPSDPAICFTIGSPERTSLLAWKCMVQTEYGGDGMVKATARYNLENQGEAQLRLLIPKGSPPLTIIDVSLDGRRVGWTPEYSKETESAPAQVRRLVAMTIDLPRTKRFPPVTVNYSYHDASLGVTGRRTLIAPKPECDVVAVDWRFLLPPGYEAPNYIAINDLPASEESNETDLSSKLSPEATLCWRTCLFGPIGRPFSERPFNPLSLDSWSTILDAFAREAWAAAPSGTGKSNEATLDSSDLAAEAKSGMPHQATSKTRVENYPDWKLYQVNYSSFESSKPIRIVHHDSLEVFRWAAFLVAIAGAIWPRSARWIRRLPVVILAAMVTIFLPPLISALASGVLMGILVALLAIWLLENGNGRSRFRRTITPDGSGSVLSATARHSRYVPTGSTMTSPATNLRPSDSRVTQKREVSDPESSAGTKIELGKTIGDNSATVIRRTITLWLLAVSLLLSGASRGPVFADELPKPEDQSTESPTRWPILIPTAPKPEMSNQETPSPADAMLYLPEPFFRSLEKLADQQASGRDLWLLKDASLRAVLHRSATSDPVQPTFLFLTFQVSVFSESAQLRLPLKQEEIQLEEGGATLDGRPVSPRWAEDGSALIIPIAGRGPHQLELTLVPLPKSHTTRWNAETQRDESGFQVSLPRFPQTKLELTYPADMPHPTIDDLLHFTQENSTTATGTLASEGRLVVWWPDDMLSAQSKELPEFDELLLLDVIPNAVTLQATWSLASGKAKTSSEGAVLVSQGNRTPNRLRDITLLVDPRLHLLELTKGFTLRPIADSPEKRRLHWSLASDPPKRVHAKFAMEKANGIGQFHAPTLRVDSGRSARYWFAVRIAPNLNYEIDLGDTTTATVTPDEFISVWQKMMPTEEKNAAEKESSALTKKSRVAIEAPSFVVANRVQKGSSWSFRTEPKSIETSVLHQTLRVSFGETSASVRFDAEWHSGSCDTPEPTLRVPENLKINSVFLIDDGIRQSVSWFSTEEGFVHLATGIIPPKRRTIRVEGTIETLDTTRPVTLPVVSLVGAEEVPLYLGIYRKPDAILTLQWQKLPVSSEPPAHITNSWLQGQLVHWLKHIPNPLKKPIVDVRIRPNRPSIRARQVVTITSPSSTPSVATAASNTNGQAASSVNQNEMVAAFELAPSKGVIDEIAIFVPNSVVGPFRTEPILPLVRSHENGKGRTIVFRPKEPIKKWHQFKLSSPMMAGETRVPDVKLCGIDELKRYVILPSEMGQGKRQQWQTRLLNRESDQAILGNLMELQPGAQLYRVVGRQWLATASTSEVTQQTPTVSLADIQVRWQKDGSYLASAVFDLNPLGNDSCMLVVPRGLTLLDTRITGIPISPTAVRTGSNQTAQAIVNTDAFRTPHSAYKIYFTSKTLPQRIEVLYQNTMNPADFKQELSSLNNIVRKNFLAPFLDVEIQQTRWTVQGPDSYVIRGKFDSLGAGEELSSTLIEESEGETRVASLTPFLTEEAALGTPVRWTTKGFHGEWKTVWLSRTPTMLTQQIPTAFLLLLIGGLALIRTVRVSFYSLLRQYRPLFGIIVGLFWWLFLSPSILGWAIIITYLIIAYRTRASRPEEDSTIIQIG